MINGNTCELIGRCNYVDFKSLENGKTYTRVCLSKKAKDDNYNAFWITFFGDTSEKVAEKIQKGDYIHVAGKLDIDKYTSKEGKQVEAIKLIGFDAQKVSYDQNKKEFVATEPFQAKEEPAQGELPWQ